MNLSWIAFIAVATMLAPLRKAPVIPSPEDFDMTPSHSARWAGGAIVLATVALYVVFR